MIEELLRVGFITFMGIILLAIAVMLFLRFVWIPVVEWMERRKRARLEKQIRQFKLRIEGPLDPIERAKYLLNLLLPRIDNRDQAMEYLYFIDPGNDVTRNASIAAALYILYQDKSR